MTGPDQAIQELADEFALLPDWEERISHVIELARGLAPLSDEERTEQTRVRGCTSQVWLVSERRPEAPEKLYFRGDSDAHLVRGEIAMLLRVFSGRTPQEILSVDPRAMFERLGLKDALTQQRSNGLFSMIARIQQEATQAA
jgi:cysteine desulfuration protein SufE